MEVSAQLQRKQHVEEHTAERASRACLCEARGRARRVRRVRRMSVDFCSSAVNTADAHANN